MRLMPQVLIMLGVVLLPVSLIALSDADARLQLQQGNDLLRQKNYAEAARCYRNAAKVQNQTIRRLAFSNLGLSEELQNKYRKAIAWYEKALVMDPKNQWLLKRISHTYYRVKKKHDKYIFYLIKALELGSTDAVQHYDMACHYALTGRPDNAIAHLYRSLFYGYTNINWIKKDNDLNSIRNHYRYQQIIKSFGTYQTIRKLIENGIKARDTGKPNDALDFMQQALSLSQAIDKVDGLYIARCNLEIGFIYYLRSDYTHSIEYYEKSRPIYLRLLGSTHPTIASVYLSLGTAYSGKNEFNHAIQLLEKALAIYLKNCSPDNPDTARTYNNLGAAYANKGEYDLAIHNYQKALPIWLDVYGSEHTEVAGCYNNLGYAFGNKGDHGKAIGYYEQSLAIRLKLLGPDHPNVAWSYNNMGVEYHNMNKIPQSLACHEKAIAIRLKRFGPDHPDVALSYDNMGIVNNWMREYDRSIVCHERALAIVSKQFGLQHPRIAVSYDYLGFVYFRKGEPARAIAYYEKALVIRLQHFGKNHSIVADTYNSLGNAYKDKGDQQRADEYHRIARDILSKKQ